MKRGRKKGKEGEREGKTGKKRKRGGKRKGGRIIICSMTTKVIKHSEPSSALARDVRTAGCWKKKGPRERNPIADPVKQRSFQGCR